MCETTANGNPIRLPKQKPAGKNGRCRTDTLIGNGTGIAGLRALLKRREQLGQHRNWLLWGERNSDIDHFCAEDCAHWQASGVLESLDLVWSRETGAERYVQERLRKRADALDRWLAAGGAVYVCGGAHGMAEGVDATLRELLGDGAVEALRAQGRYRRDVY